MRTPQCLAAMALSVAAFLAAAPAHAENKCDDDQAAANKKAGKNFHTEIVNGQKVYVIDTVITVCGKVPRPSVVYVLQARTINYEWENLKQDFLPLVIASVKKAPF